MRQTEGQAPQAQGAVFVKINSDFNPQAGQATTATDATAAAASVQAPKTSAGGKTSAGDQANFSSEAQQFALLSSQATNVPDVRQDRVASLKTAIQNGTYNVSNQQIAQAMSRDFNPA
jgi:negative regulator of flagellin synthesis FlgM